MAIFGALFVLFIIIIFLLISVAVGVATNNLRSGVITGFICFGIFGLCCLSLFLLSFFSQKKLLEKDDYYGEYTIDRTFFAGKQADWQYNTFRFEIKENDSIYFYVTNQERKLRTYKGVISTIKPYSSEVLVINMQKPAHPVLKGNPGVYRGAWSFYLVFKSAPYGSMFFIKNEWEPIHK
jgi:hypothetical protein